MYCSMVFAIVSATSSFEYSWSESRLKSGDLNSSRLSDLKCFLDDRNSHNRYVVSNGGGYAVLISWIEYDVLDGKLDTPYTAEVDTPYSAIDQNSLQDYALWEVIKNGNSFKPKTLVSANTDGTSTLTISGPVTTEKKIQKRNDVKARSILLMALPNENQLTFNQHKVAKTLFEAIQSRFGGNDATKKTQKTLLKQTYENFNASKDLNLKFLRSLPAEWNTHVVVWRNKPDLETMSIDDLYNNFKIVEQEVKTSVSSSSNSGSQNMAFVSTPGSTNEYTAYVQVSTASAASTNDTAASLSDATVYAFLTNQPNGSQLAHEDLEQIHDDDLEEMDLKWQLALLSMRARKFYQRTRKKITIYKGDTVGFDKMKVECFNCHKLGHFARECRNPRSQESRARSYDQGNRSQDNSRRTVNVEDTSSKAIVAIDGAGFDWSYMAEEEVPTNMALMAFSDSEFNLSTYKRGLASVEEQLVFYKKNEVMFTDQIVVLKRDASFNESKIITLKIQIEKLKKDEENNPIKIDNYENASKSLDKLIGSQITDNNRKGVRYNVVPPLPTGLFAPPTIDLSNSGLEEFKQPEFEGYGPKANKSVSVDATKEIEKTFDALIIEDWISKCDEDESKVKVLKTDNVQHKPEQANQPRNVSQNPRNFAPTTILTKSGIVPMSTARQRAATPVSAARPINTDAPKSFVNVAKPRINAFQKSHLPSRRPFYQQTTLKNRNLKNKFNIVKINSVDTTKAKRVTSAIGKQGINAIKPSACWVWRPKRDVIDHISKTSGSYICKPFNYVDPTGRLKHMTGNKSYLTDYQDYDGGFVAFAGSSKGGFNFWLQALHCRFWQTATVKTVNNGEQKIIATVDGHKFSITEASVRRHLQLADVDGISSLPNTKIFEKLTLMGFLNQHDRTYVAPTLTNKLFSNMKIGFAGVHVPLFDTMLIHDQPGQEHPTQEPTSEPITTPTSPPFTEPQIPQTTSSMPHDSPLSGGYTPGSVEGSMKLNELTNLCTKLVDRVKHLEDKLKSTKARRKARMVLSDEEEDLVSEDPTKQGRMEETENKGVEEEYPEVEYHFDQTLLAAKILAEASSERIKTYKKRRRSTDSSKVSTAKGIFSTAEDIQGTDEEVAIKVQEEEQAKALEHQEQERANLEAAQELQRQFDQERQETDDIDWNKIVEQKDPEVGKTEKKRVAEETMLQESFKKLRTAQASSSEPIQEQSTEEPKELSKEDLKKMMEIVPVEEVKAKVLQAKYPIID
ncbi:putative ribonuclease H-like domain-containing protein [Tanacetum coccineum]|uniref:Ribonuclease H-like domain-containing protein n=1 Tax=Tanacetum coccineum TaxID=301880 RepID=A0ABQ5F0G7_9ASTR